LNPFRVRPEELPQKSRSTFARTQIAGLSTSVRLRALLLGLSPAEIERRLPEIVEFTELDDYLDMPVRT